MEESEQARLKDEWGNRVPTELSEALMRFRVQPTADYDDPPMVCLDCQEMIYTVEANDYLDVLVSAALTHRSEECHAPA